MHDLIIFPKPQTLRRNVVFCAILVVAAILVCLLSKNLELKMSAFVGLPLFVGALGVTLYRWLRPTPLFHGTSIGFAVKGKQMQSWAGFSHVEVKRRTVGPIRLPATVRIKTGASRLRGRVTFRADDLPAAPDVIADQIRTYAAQITASKNEFGTPQTTVTA